MKTCQKCKQEKELDQFGKNSSRKDGLFFWCRPCHAEYGKKYKEENKEKVKEKQRQWHAAHHALTKERNRVWHRENRTAANERNRRNYSENPSRQKICSAIRRAIEKRAAPAWRNQFFIEEAYHLAALRTKMLGLKWSVDHIVPLKSKLVCGLHVEHNLQVIPAVANIRKGNRVWPDMPGV